MINLQPHKEYKSVDLNFAKQIPSDWIVLRGKFLFREINERSKKGEEKLLSVSEHRGIVPRDSINVTMFQALSYEGYKLCNKGDIVINSLWAWHRGLGVSEYHGIVSTAYGVYRPRNPEQWNHRYLNYLLRDNTYVGECLIRSKGIWESRYQLTGSNFLDIPILQPPLEVQNSIVQYLDKKNSEIDKFIQNKEKLIALLEEQKKAIIQSFINSGEIYIKLKYLLKIQNGDGFSSDLVQNEGEFAVYGGNGILGYYNKYNVHDETLIIGRVGALCGNVHYTNKKVWVNDNAMFVKTRNSYKYMYYLLLNANLNSLSFANAQPLITGTLIKNHSTKFHKEMETQKSTVLKIEKKLGELNLVIEKAQKEIELIKEYREALITDLVTGKRSIPQT